METGGGWFESSIPDVDNNVIDDEIVEASEVEKPSMSKERAIQWLKTAKFIVVFYLCWTALMDVLDVVLGLNKPGLAIDVIDASLATLFVLIAVILHKNLKRAIQAVK